MWGEGGYLEDPNRKCKDIYQPLRYCKSDMRKLVAVPPLLKDIGKKW